MLRALLVIGGASKAIRGQTQLHGGTGAETAHLYSNALVGETGSSNPSRSYPEPSLAAVMGMRER